MRVLHADADNVFVSEGRLVVQVRRGTMTHQTLDMVEKHMAGWTSKEIAGYLVVMEESAGVPEADVRKRQQITVRKALIDGGSYVAVIMLATGVRASILRAISRTMSIGFPRTSTFSDIEVAARWMAPLAGVSVQHVIDLVAQARATAPR